MATYGASNNLLVSKFDSAHLPCPLGERIKNGQSEYMLVLSKDTITVGMCVQWKPSVAPSARQVIRTDHTSTVTMGLACGFAMCSNVTGDYFFIKVKGPYNSAIDPTLITDGSAAINGFCAPSATTDGTIIAGVLGTDDGNMVCRNTQADSGNDLTEYIVCGPLMGA